MGSPNPHTNADSGRPTVLIVDDDEYVHGALEAALRGMHLRLVTARTAADGMRLAIAHRPALAIIDVGLPDVDGYTLTADLREAGLTGTRVLILTGHSPNEAAARLAGVDVVVSKPFRLHQFLDLVREQLEARPVQGPTRPVPATGTGIA